jgi:dTDP-4-dehydrorhamnose 3,5-epimerase
MKFQETSLPGVWLIDLNRLKDERGFFARSFCRSEFELHGLSPDVVQCNISFNQMKGTLRGMHYQTPPCAEDKLVRGSIYDVVVDLRLNSKTFLQWLGFSLDAESRTALYVPKYFAHGFLTLEDQTEVFYQMSEFYSPQHAAGFRWDDAAVGIRWPAQVKVISPKDAAYPDLDAAMFYRPRMLQPDASEVRGYSL